jgi:hypothetical protein
LKLEKTNCIEAVLKGIKGQYLLLENNQVFNVRSHEGFIADFSYEETLAQGSLF